MPRPSSHGCSVELSRDRATGDVHALRAPGPSPYCTQTASAEEDLGLGVERGIDRLEPCGRLGKRYPDDVGAAQRDHLSEVLVPDRVDGVQPEAGGEPAVEGAGRAPALD